MGGRTVLITGCSSGFGGHALFEQFPDATVRAMYDTNVFGLMNVTRAVLPRMREQGDGCVINVTSVSGLLGTPTASIYSSTKFAAILAPMTLT